MNAKSIKIREHINYITVDDCAKRLGVSKSTIYQMLRDGRIENAFRINRSWRIPVMDAAARKAKDNTVNE